MCSECQSPVWQCCQNKSNLILILPRNMCGSCLRHVNHFIHFFIHLLSGKKSRFSLSVSHGEGVKWCDEQSRGPEVRGCDHAADAMELMSVCKKCPFSVHTSSCMTRGLAWVISSFKKICFY